MDTSTPPSNPNSNPSPNRADTGHRSFSISPQLRINSEATEKKLQSDPVLLEMDPSTPPPDPNPNPNPSPGPNVYQIGGVPVEFPYKPYGSQLAFMGRMISTLDRARRQGKSHALLESPTGTGKSLSLLCSSLAWQQHQRNRQPPEIPSSDPAHDPLVDGGGFIPESEPSRSMGQPPKAMGNRAQMKLTAPKIFYASRTHGQISQLIREYRKTSYRVPMAILASRKHYCTNKYVCISPNLDQECKSLLKDKEAGCPEFKNVHKVKNHPSLKKGGCHDAHDIEDLVKVGRTVKGCSYFASQALAEEAQLVFCPYNYIINPIVRRASDIDIKGSIVILDEAHNIEDMARDAGSLDVEEEILYALQTELGQLSVDEAMIYQPLYEMIQGIISWICIRAKTLQKREFELYASYWTGDKALEQLQQAGITQQCFPILQECATKAIKAVSDAELGESYLTGISAAALEGLFSSLSYLFSGNGCHAYDYQLAIKRYVKRDEKNAASGWMCSLSLWCLNPAIVFKEIANLSFSIILTSGTLYPMSSFASELGVQFDTCMEAPHVIDVDSQLWASIISSGPGNFQLNASYKTADEYDFQDSLGASLEEICKIVPGGALVFFPSYKLLEKLRSRWCQTGQWSRLNAQKPIFVEPRGSTDEFEPLLKDYYASILGNHKVFRRKPKQGPKAAVKNLSTENSSQNPVQRGAVFLAVCRGKVSEGIDFSDENARVAVIVGIPFPNINDIQVVMKKKYNDTYKSSKGLLSGSEWYCQQAFRALNQAAGRCIRHRLDYGAIILLDERFKEERNLAYISKWLRKSIKKYDSFDESLEGLRTFFQEAEKRVSPKSKDGLQNVVSTSDTNKDNLPSPDIQLRQKRNQKQKKPNSQNSKKTIPENSLAQPKNHLTKASSFLPRVYASPAEPISQCNTKPKAADRTKEFIDLESSSPKDSRLPETFSTETSMNSLDQLPFPKDTATDYQKVSQTDKNSMVQTHNQSPDQLSSLYSTISNGNLSESVCASTISPERIANARLCNPELKSSLNMSVNSCSLKRRKLVDSQLTGCHLMDHFSTLDAESFIHSDCPSGRTIYVDIEKSTESRNKLRESNQGEGNRSMLPLSTDLSIGKQLHICCSSCKTSLGLPAYDFSVPYFPTSLSKAYLTYVLKYGPTRTCLLDDLSKTQQTDTSVVICDVSSIDNSILNSGLQHDIWSKGDGCVFRALCCPFCTGSMKCLGVQVMATDAANTDLLNKILFYADHLDKRIEQTAKQESILPTCTNVGRDSDPVEIEKFSYNPQPKNRILTTAASRLRLPKRVHVSSKNQDRDDT